MNTKRYIRAISGCIFLIAIQVLYIIPAVGQNTYNVWHFGQYKSLDFSTQPPVFAGSMVNSDEGSASICDNQGQLLFSTNGVTVRNRNGLLMPNGTGLNGHSSSTQSALIVPDPANSNKYYIFTADQGGYVSPNTGLFYNIVDMTLQVGNGAVVLKNQVLYPPAATEKLTAVPHCNGKAYWIISHLQNSDAYCAFLLDSSGIDTVPVISHVGSVHDTVLSFSGTIGFLKSSFDGKKLVAAVFGSPSFVELLDFDNATGMVSNPLLLSSRSSQINYGYYGVSFSPDNSKVYATWVVQSSLAGSELHQWDLSSGNPATIVASDTIVATLQSGNKTLGGLQTGPDHKLYVIVYSFPPRIDVVHNPDLPGSACNYQPSYITGITGNTSLCFPNNMDAGIPDLSPSLLTSDTMVCGTSMQLAATPVSGSLLWNTGDTSQSINIAQTGTYWVQATNPTCYGLIADTIHVDIQEPFTVSLGDDREICGDRETFTLPFPDNSLVWSTGQTQAQVTFTNPGTYSVQVISGACEATDSVTITFLNVNTVLNPPNVFTPNGDLINDYFDAGNPEGYYSQQIFDRWGALIFESTSPQVRWDGRLQDKDLPEGVYYWIIKMTDCKNELQERTGFVTLAR